MDNTRKYDLEKLEEYRDMGNKNAGKVLEKAYKESKDQRIESYRAELIKAHKQNDVPKTEKIEEEIREYTKRNYGR